MTRLAQRASHLITFIETLKLGLETGQVHDGLLSVLQAANARRASDEICFSQIGADGKAGDWIDLSRSAPN
jgi:hypothetical protein